MVVNTNTLNAHPELGKALVGAWYETLALMSRRGNEGKAAKAAMAKLAGCTPQEFDGQLATTAMYWKPKDAADYAESKELKKTMDLVRRFCFDHGLLGKGAKNADVVGIKYPDGSVVGDSNNVTVIYDSTFVRKAQEELEK
jgi:NitT/TauT family transport system substrate-binding protein